MTPTEVSNFYKIPRDSVKSIVRRAKPQNLEEAPKQLGRRPKLGPRCIRRLIIFVRKNNRMPLFMIAAQFRTLDGVPLTPKTIRKYLHKSGINSYVAAAKPYLSTKHIDARLNWCILRQQWTLEKWKTVAFTDEASFTLRPLKNHTRVWRTVRTRYVLQNMVPTFKSGYVSLSVWGMFS